MYYTEEELKHIGFKKIGKDVSISTKCSIYGASNISIGNNVRIDDFTLLSAGAGGIEIGDHIHIAVFSFLIGAGKIVMHDFSGISARVSIYSSNSDYMGNYLANPNLPAECLQITNKDVVLHKHALVGCGSVILPGVTLYEGAVVGALSFVKNDCDPYTIYGGNPAKKLKERNRDGIMFFENEMIKKGLYVSK